MKFSIIMPSYLGAYSGAAKDRPGKLVRAINSVLDQSFTDWELRVVADGCLDTASIVASNFSDPRITVALIEKRPLWCVGVRNRGIANAKGEHIVYLDTDDYFDRTHLQGINSALEYIPLINGWGYFNANFYSKRVKAFVERDVNIGKCSTYGTANIIHLNLGLLWPDPPKDRLGNYDYGNQDCAFVEELKKLGPGVELPPAGYMVCHEPNLLRIDV